MAPNSKSVPSGRTRRDYMQKQLQKIQHKESEQDKVAIQKLQEALQKKDEEIAAMTTEQLEAMDVDVEDATGEQDGAKDGSGGEDEEGEQNEAETRNEAVAESKKKKKRKVIIPSIEKDTNLFVSDDESNGSDDDTDDVAFHDKEYGKALYTFPAARPSNDVTTVGWCSGRFNGYVNRYGKKSAARYRLGGFASSEEYEDNPPQKEKVSNPKNRYGDELRTNGKPKYTSRHIYGIMGVAWKGIGPNPSEDDLDLINPTLVSNWKGTHTYVLIAWQIDDKILKTWETRSSLRRRYGEVNADVAIYEAAYEAENNYVAAKTGKRPANSKSPSVGLAQGYVDKYRERSLGIHRPTPARSLPTRSLPPQPSPSRSKQAGRKPKLKQPETKPMEELKEDFLNDYLELMGAESFDSLSRSEKRECIAAWRDEKASFLLDDAW